MKLNEYFLNITKLEFIHLLGKDYCWRACPSKYFKIVNSTNYGYIFITIWRVRRELINLFGNLLNPSFMMLHILPIYLKHHPKTWLLNESISSIPLMNRLYFHSHFKVIFLYQRLIDSLSQKCLMQNILSLICFNYLIN